MTSTEIMCREKSIFHIFFFICIFYDFSLFAHMDNLAPEHNMPI